MTIKEVSLFTGMGGGLLGSMLLGGITPIALCEIDPTCRALLRKRFGKKIIIHDDVRTFVPPKCDLLTGGFPCQDISAAGGKRGIMGPKSSLFFSMIRCIEHAQPSIVFAENSDRLRTKGLAVVLEQLANIGYGRIAWATIGAAAVGAPHLRKRMWIMAESRGSRKVRHHGELPPHGMLHNGLVEPLDLPPRDLATKGVMPTLTGGDARKSGNRRDPNLWSLSDMLGITRKAWNKTGRALPTLAATDWKAPYSTQGLLKQLEKRSKPLRDILPYLEGAPGKYINPTWAEWYMGWPINWTDGNKAPDVDYWRKRVLTDLWWTDDKEPHPRVIDNGSRANLERIEALGNGQVPAQMARAFIRLRKVLLA